MFFFHNRGGGGLTIMENSIKRIFFIIETFPYNNNNKNSS